MSNGVRGPRGPQGGSSPERSWLESWSRPLLTRLVSAPRWLIVVGMSALLVLGLIQTGSLAWLGAILLGILALFLGWLLALSWPVLAPGSRMLRLVVVLVLAGIAVLKAMGRF